MLGQAVGTRSIVGFRIEYRAGFKAVQRWTKRGSTTVALGIMPENGAIAVIDVEIALRNGIMAAIGGGINTMMKALTLKEFSLRLRRNCKFPNDDELAVFDFLLRPESEGWSRRIDDSTLMVNCWVYRFDKNHLHALIDSFIDANEDHLRELWRARPHAEQSLRVSWVEGEDFASVLGRSESVRLPMPAYVTATDSRCRDLSSGYLHDGAEYPFRHG